MYLDVVSTWSRVPTGEMDWTVSREFETENLLKVFIFGLAFVANFVRYR